ncbi:MAG: ABC transporter ATP-binding protein [Proteobacteria bacterium]|nr:ABC transporter ATP-binding protein [Pseudomonadota bacterium]
MTIELRHVVKRVGAEVHIHETSVAFESDGFNILLGTTLAGKTSLIQLMAGLERPTSGEIWLDGRNVTAVSVQKRNVSMVHQQFINYSNFSVFDNIASPLRVARLPRAEIERRVGEVAEILRLSGTLDRKPHELSGGQQQRIALARALVKDADLILLDEPLANLDYKLREELRDELPRLFKDRGCTVIYATTEPTEALLLGGHTATMHEGRITQFGPTAEVYRRPTGLRTARVFSDPPINTASVTKRGSRFILNDRIGWDAEGARAELPDGDYIMGIRPHHVTPHGSGPGTVELEGTVLVTELSGSESVVHFDLDGQAWISQSHGIHPFKIGSTARFYMDIGKSKLFDLDDRLVAA